MKKSRKIKSFRIQEERDRYIGAYEITNKPIFYIQELRKRFFGLGKERWKNIQVYSYGARGDVCFSTLKEAKKYLKDLRGMFNDTT